MISSDPYDSMREFTLSKQMPGPDHAGSMEPQELAELKRFAHSFAAILYHHTDGAAVADLAAVDTSETTFARAASVA